MTDNIVLMIVIVISCASFFSIGYIYYESREEDENGNVFFSTTRCGVIIKRIFGTCLPNSILLCFANALIACGEVGSSCMESVKIESDLEEKKRAARVAASLSKLSKKKKKTIKTQKNEEFESLEDNDDVEMPDNTVDLSDHDEPDVSSVVSYKPKKLPSTQTSFQNKSNQSSRSNTESPRNSSNSSRTNNLAIALPTLSSSLKQEYPRHANSSHGTHNVQSPPPLITRLSGRDLKELIDAEDRVLGTGTNRHRSGSKDSASEV